MNRLEPIKPRKKSGSRKSKLPCLTGKSERDRKKCKRRLSNIGRKSIKGIKSKSTKRKPTRYSRTGSSSLSSSKETITLRKNTETKKRENRKIERKRRLPIKRSWHALPIKNGKRGNWRRRSKRKSMNA